MVDKQNEPCVRVFLPEKKTLTHAKLDWLQANADARGINLQLIENARCWLVLFQQECGKSWQEPDRLFYDDVEEEICFLWELDTGLLSFSILLETVTYLRSWESDVSGNVEFGEVASPEERALLWQPLQRRANLNVLLLGERNV